MPRDGGWGTVSETPFSNERGCILEAYASCSSRGWLRNVRLEGQVAACEKHSVSELQNQLAAVEPGANNVAVRPEHKPSRDGAPSRTPQCLSILDNLKLIVYGKRNDTRRSNDQFSKDASPNLGLRGGNPRNSNLVRP